MGIKTTLLGMGGLLLAVGGPIGYFSADDAISKVKKEWFSGSEKPEVGQTVLPELASAPADPLLVGVYPTPTANLPSRRSTTTSLDEVLRFDVTVDWIMRRWPRVSTGLPYLQLQGYRVSLVSGTKLGDVAGSLTYYFNSRQQLQRIELRGTTGDPSALAGLASNRFHFVRRLTNDPGVVCYETVDSVNRTTGALKIRTARTIESSRPYTRFEVHLVVDRPE